MQIINNQLNYNLHSEMLVNRLILIKKEKIPKTFDELRPIQIEPQLIKILEKAILS